MDAYDCDGIIAVERNRLAADAPSVDPIPGADARVIGNIAWTYDPSIPQ